jgi:hypothetical protein
MRLVNRFRFRKDDPLRDLHVPKKDRLSDDRGIDSTALDQETGDDIDFDRDEVRNDPRYRGRVVRPEDLQ